jgi:hypothetical protein
MIPALILSIATVGGVPQTAGAQTAARCAASKLKATGKKCADKAKCVAKAARGGTATIDPVCLAKAEGRFARSFQKAETRGGCLTVGHAPEIEAMVDAHVSDVLAELWTNRPFANECAGTKLIAAGRDCTCKLKCSERAALTEGGVDGVCLARCESALSTRFDAAETKGGCTTSGDGPVVEGKNQALVAAVESEIDPPTSSTTTTTISTTTTTTCNCCVNTKLEVVSNAPSPIPTGSVQSTGSCSEAPGLEPCDSDTDCTGFCSGPPVTTLTLTSGGLYGGGNGVGIPLPELIPDQAKLILRVTDCSPTAETFQLAGASAAEVGGSQPWRHCTSASVQSPEYPGKPGCLVGSPLPIPNGATSMCIIKRIATDPTGTGTCRGTVADAQVGLMVDLYMTGPQLGEAPCPRCLDGGGTCAPGTACCESGPNANQPCVPGNTLSGASHPTSHDCPPPPPSFIGSKFEMLSLTSGTATKTATDFLAMNQVFCGFCGRSAGAQPLDFRGVCTGGTENGKICNGAVCGTCVTAAACVAGGGSCTPTACTADATCSTFATGCGASGSSACNRCRQRTAGAFGAGAAQTITEVGQPANACIATGSHSGRLVSVFCIPPAFDTTVDANGDYPGPGAVSLDGTFRMLP